MSTHGRAKKRPLSVAVPGRLTDYTDSTSLYAKRQVLAQGSQDSGAMVRGLSALKEDAPHGVIRIGGLCSGSGLGSICIKTLVEQIVSFSTGGDGLSEFPLTTSFDCESDEAKAKRLMAIGTDVVFKNVEIMGQDEVEVWSLNAEKRSVASPPRCEILHAGASCKDFSSLNNSGVGVVSNINAMLALMTISSDAEIDESLLEGTSARTLRGVLMYIAKYRPAIVLLENVVQAKDMMDSLFAFLHKCGYETFIKEINPTTFGIPNNRPRLYFGGRSKITLKDPTLFADGFHKAYMRIVGSFSDMSQMSLDTFLLPPDDPYFEKCVAEKNTRSCDDDGCSWPTDHDKCFTVAKVRRPTEAQLTRLRNEINGTASQKLFGLLSHRKQEVAYFHSVQASKEEGLGELFVDISQTIERTRTAGTIPCFTSSSVIWLARNKRILVGREMLAIQGMSKQGIVGTSTDSLLHSLAGNSYSAPCFMAVMGAILQQS